MIKTILYFYCGKDINYWKVICETILMLFCCKLFYRFRRSSQQSKIMVFVVIHLSNAAIILSNNKSVLIKLMVEQKLTYIGKPLLYPFSEYAVNMQVDCVSVVAIEVNSSLIAFPVMRLFIEPIKTTQVHKYLFGCLTLVNVKSLVCE